MSLLAAARLFAIPITAGTESEATPGAVISDEQTHQKSLVVDPRLVPLATALDSGIMAGMPPSITDDTGLDALTHALAAHWGGLALNRAGLGYVHGIAHQPGARYGMPHGRANAMVLPYVLAFNRQASGQRLADLARRVGLADADTPASVAAERLINRVR